ncbi:DEAD/DEAH box helicase [Halopseudomonas bauzanensis]|uniref:ATP-dependent helicase Lhr and Lhr-like helicase n=1 Tax=Halopseudomonas bauzanensis TaxID=653930 RepID=A0A1I4LJ00_9GAMM|nr:DEAD/DEAH box helicase [Halopseudomonas bauzanensis]SER90270.1 ATP-dependent helicase Lhr and Lhr-like helicase [Halopseudomonas bauzanensis]SFL91078.1 ATP-dependent helicase Lhr and Lhr-like helicase [Halopseudomonas bauzanensis]
MEAYQKLDIRVQKWVFQQGWPDLREIQKMAIDPVLKGDRDVLISASTAAGKTESAFLPACTAIADQEQGFGILYISPLKALINDQYRRLESLCDALDMQLTPWHGDSAAGLKNKARKAPSGILLITPESLEAMLIRRSGWAKQTFENLQYIIIDEFHAFIGTERGQQLLSVMNRLDHLVGRLKNPIPRIALSATLGDLESVPALLRPNGSLPCQTITSTQGRFDLRMQVKGYLDPAEIKPKESRIPAEARIIRELYRICRGGSHLVFANSRQRTELIAASLTDLCATNHVPNEFFPHHGSLSKDMREDVERRLQSQRDPTTAICTTTIELGIDVGKINSVAQVNAPPSVSSMRQRTGRSGRRDGVSVLRMFLREREITTQSGVSDKLRLELIQSLAMIRLMVSDKWFEPADSTQYHFSTLIHQTLALVAQWGGIRADQVYALLCQQGPFQKTSIQQFKDMLTHLGKLECLTQLSSGELVLGIKGEQLVNQYKFYAVFQTPEEYRVVNGNKTIGTLPVDSPLLPDQHIVFGGRRWKISEIDEVSKTILVNPSKGGLPPQFSGSGIALHTRVRQEMFKIYSEAEYRIPAGDSMVDYIDEEARHLVQEGFSFFTNAGLAQHSVIDDQGTTHLFSWMGDKIVNTLCAVLQTHGFTTSNQAGIVEIVETSADNVTAFFKQLDLESIASEAELAQIVQEKNIEKFDELLPPNLLCEGYGRRMFDVGGTKAWIAQNFPHEPL